MALFFNINNLELEAQGNPDKLIALLTYHYEGKTLNSKNQKYKISKRSLKGNSYLLNPSPILYNKDIDSAYLSQYIKLAGRRDLSLFKLYNAIGLDTSFYPDLNMNNIKNNPLLIISNNLIQFKFEEIYHGSKVR